MSHTLELELPDHIYQAARQVAAAKGLDVEQVLVEALESWLPLAELGL